MEKEVWLKAVVDDSIVGRVLMSAILAQKGLPDVVMGGGWNVGILGHLIQGHAQNRNPN